MLFRKLPPTLVLLLSTGAALFVPGVALARGGHGGSGGAGGRSGGGAHAGRSFPAGAVVVVGRTTVGGPSTEASSSVHPTSAPGFSGFGRVGGEYGTYLYVGDDSVWEAQPHWHKGYWAGGAEEGWSWYAGPWWAAPAYPGWVWVGQPWVWDGERMISQEGYWTTANMAEGAAPPAFGESAGD